jgi:broad specificity phosphatase PhoE
MSDEVNVPSAERRATTLLLVRHGQTDSNVRKLLHGHGDVPLTERGIAQAALIAARLAREVGIVALYASPLERAHHTARVIGEAIGHAPILHRGLREINFGAVEGLTVEEAWERFPHLRPTEERRYDLELQWPEGESRRGFRERAHATLRELLARHRGEMILVVAHGGIINAGVSMLLREESPTWGRYEVGNCSLTQLTWDDPDGVPTVVCLDDREHLGEE